MTHPMPISGKTPARDTTHRWMAIHADPGFTVWADVAGNLWLMKGSDSVQEDMEG